MSADDYDDDVDAWSPVIVYERRASGRTDDVSADTDADDDDDESPDIYDEDDARSVTVPWFTKEGLASDG